MFPNRPLPLTFVNPALRIAHFVYNCTPFWKPGTPMAFTLNKHTHTHTHTQRLPDVRRKRNNYINQQYSTTNTDHRSPSRDCWTNFLTYSWMQICEYATIDSTYFKLKVTYNNVNRGQKWNVNCVKIPNVRMSGISFFHVTVGKHIHFVSYTRKEHRLNRGNFNVMTPHNHNATAAIELQAMYF